MFIFSDYLNCNYFDI